MKIHRKVSLRTFDKCFESEVNCNLISIFLHPEAGESQTFPQLVHNNWKIFHPITNRKRQQSSNNGEKVLHFI